MARASVWIIIGLVCINASATVWSASGAADDWGVEPSVGGDNFITDLKTEAKSIGGNVGTASFLVGLIVRFALLLIGFFEFIFAGPIMFNNLGVPGWITTFVFAPMYAIALFDGIYVYTGRDL